MRKFGHAGYVGMEPECPAICIIKQQRATALRKYRFLVSCALLIPLCGPGSSLHFLWFLYYNRSLASIMIYWSIYLTWLKPTTQRCLRALKDLTLQQDKTHRQKSHERLESKETVLISCFDFDLILLTLWISADPLQSLCIGERLYEVLL